MPKISKYTAITVPQDTDVLVIVQGGVTKKVPLSTLANYFMSKVTPTAENDFLIASGSPLVWTKKTLAGTKTILG